MIHYHQTINSPVGILHLVADEQALHALTFEQVWARFKKKFPDLTETTSLVLEKTKQQLAEYFDGKRTAFDLPLQLNGTPFQNKVWAALANIPFGQTSTYKQQALAVDSPRAVRAVGQTNGLNPFCIVLPCHRVVGSNGALTGFAGGLPTKKFLLELERIGSTAHLKTNNKETLMTFQKSLIAFITLTLVTVASAADKSKKTAPVQATSTMDAAMAQAIKLGTPGENHAVLASLVGTWNCTVRGWMKTGDKPQESKGTATNTMVLGGRFLRQDFKGDWAGQPFEGTGYTGFDNLKGEFQSIWMDNMSTGMMQSAGTYDGGTKTINTSGTFSCPMTNEKNRWVRSENKIVDNNTNIYTSYFKGTDGNEFKAMEITYTRAQ